MTEEEPPINFHRATQRLRVSVETRVWAQRINPAASLRSRFITGPPWFLRALYAPRTSRNPNRVGRCFLPDNEPIA